MTNTSGIFRERTRTPEEVEMLQLRKQFNNQKSIIQNLQRQYQTQRDTIKQLIQECKTLKEEKADLEMRLFNATKQIDNLKDYLYEVGCDNA